MTYPYIITWWQPMVKWTQNVRKQMQIGKEINANYKESTVAHQLQVRG